MADLGALEQVLTRTKRRIRLARAVSWLGYGAVLGLSAGFLHGALRRVQGGEADLAAGALLVVGCLAVVCLARLSLRVRAQEAAAKLDAAHALHDRVQSAVEFAAYPADQRTRFMDAALRDSLARAGELSPRQAVRFERPRGLVWALAPAALWLLVMLWPSQHAAAVKPVVPARARAISDDDLAAFRGELRALAERGALTPEASADVTRYNALLEQLATGELTRAEALEALLSMEKKLLEAEQGSEEDDRAALRELATDLARADEALAETLSQESEAEKAAEKLRELAAQNDKGALDAAAQKRLQEALERIRQREAERDDNQKRKEELESLLKKKEQNPPTDPGEKSLFEKQKRELERLRREQAQLQKRNRELSRLSRDLGDGARPASDGSQSGASDAMRRGAEDLKRYANDRMTQQQREELARQVQQLREQMQRQGDQGQGQGQQGGGQSERQRRFQLRAQGQDPDSQEARIVMKKPGQGQQGQGQQGQGQQGQGQQGQGQQGQGQQGQQGQGQQGQQGQGQEGEGEGEGQGQGKGPMVLELGGDGPSSGVLEVPGGGGSETVQQQVGAGQDHDDTTLRAPTDLDAEHADSRLAGQHGKGPTRSEVILDAADRGFGSTGYRKVYTDYKAHAEDVLERDQVPPGYRFYVRRYFQLIRPRDRKEAP